MWDDPETEAIFAERGDGQADAIDGDRPLLDQVTGSGFRQRDDQIEIRSLGFRGEDLGRGVDVPLHEVTAEASVGTQGSFEIHPGSRSEAAEIGPGEGLPKQVEGCRVPIGRGDGEAAAVDGQAFTK